MVSIKIVAAIVNLLDSIWSILLTASASTLLTFSIGPIPPLGLPGWILLTVAIILLVDSFICFFQLTLAFYVAGILSIILIVVLALIGNPAVRVGSLLGIALSVVGVVLNLLAARSRFRIPEESHPLNLPVFG